MSTDTRQPVDPADIDRAPELGRPAFLDGDPRRLYLVTGTFPGDDVEVVSFAQIRDRSTVTTGSITDAIADGRLFAKRCDADRLTPYPAKWSDRIEIEEVRR